MAKVVIKKMLPDKCSDIHGYEKTFVPIYFLYKDNKCVGRYLNIYEAAREAERRYDLSELEFAYQQDPSVFCAIKKD